MRSINPGLEAREAVLIIRLSNATQEAPDACGRKEGSARHSHAIVRSLNSRWGMVPQFPGIVPPPIVGCYKVCAHIHTHN